MPIIGRTPAEAFKIFADYLTTLLARTITQMPLIPVFYSGASDMALSFRPSATSSSAPVHTRYGALGLEIGQRCATVAIAKRQYQLQTVSYRYTIGHMGDENEPLFRWEYIKHPAGDRAYYCRHHFQGPMPTGLHLDSKETLFQDIHLPTGWVPIEEVIRFCLHDLGAHAVCEPEDWDRILRESRETFMTGFSARGEV